MNTQIKIVSRQVNLRRSEIDLILGYHMEDDVINETLSFLGFKYIVKNDIWVCTIPTFQARR